MTPEIKMPLNKILNSILLVTIGAPRGVGRLSIKDFLIGSIPNVKAGGPSMIMFTHNSCNAVNGAFNPIKTVVNTTATDARLTVS